MKSYIIICITVFCLTACSSVPRTKWTDKTMRVMIDPANIDTGNYVRIQQALVASGKWVVIDRGIGMEAVAREQELTQRVATDRFADREKFAHWGKLYGVGGVIVAHTQCAVKQTFFTDIPYARCAQYLAIVDSNTGEVIATAEGDQSTDLMEQSIAPSWKDVVASLNDNYPKDFKPSRDTQMLEDYKELSKEEAVRQKERIARDVAAKQEGEK